MAPAILVPKLEVSFHDFDPNPTRDKLREILKEGGLKQAGLKKELTRRAKENGLLPEPGPRWFFFDEAFGRGEHKPFYMCKCHAPMSLHRFTISSSGVVNPSLWCGNRKCRFHIWGKFEDWDGGQYGGKSYYRCKIYERYSDIGYP